MLKSMIFSLNFFRFIQNGMYVDFFIKKLTEVFCRNMFIYSAQFFGEKYIIEYYTKKIIESYVFNLNQKYNIFVFYYSYFFVYNLSIMFIFFSFTNFFFILY